MIEQVQAHSDKPFKSEFIQFIQSKTWHWFITIPIGECDHDDAVLQRLRRIENQFCRKYLVNRYHKLRDAARFSMTVGFEGERKSGNRHAHILVYIPQPTKKCISHHMMINLFEWEFRWLWTTMKRVACKPNLWTADRRNCLDWVNDLVAISFGKANVARSIYTAKSVRQCEVPWSRFEFVTLPKHPRFTNRNLSVIRNRSRQRRNHLKRIGDPFVNGHVV